VVDGDPCGKIWWHGEVSHPASLAVDSSEELLLEDEGDEADLFPGLDSDKEGWWRPVTGRRGNGGGAE
jgi:hypothetical protein